MIYDKNKLRKTLRNVAIVSSTYALLSGCTYNNVGVTQRYDKNMGGINVVPNTLLYQATEVDRVNRGVKSLEERLKSGKAKFTTEASLLKTLEDRGVHYEIVDQTETYAKIAVSGAINGILLYISLKGIGGGSSSSSSATSGSSTTGGSTGYATGSINGGNVVFIPNP